MVVDWWLWVKIIWITRNVTGQMLNISNCVVPFSFSTLCRPYIMFITSILMMVRFSTVLVCSVVCCHHDHYQDYQVPYYCYSIVTNLVL